MNNKIYFILIGCILLCTSLFSEQSNFKNIVVVHTLNADTFVPRSSNVKCIEIINKSKDSFLSICNPILSWNEESSVLSCWIEEILNGNQELYSLLLARLNLRLKAINNGELKYLNTVRVNSELFSKIITNEMLDIAFGYASIDTCVFYSGEGATHYGLVNLHVLLNLVDPEYRNTFNFYKLNILMGENSPNKYNETTCEYANSLYSKLYLLIQADYKSNSIRLRKEVPINKSE